MQQGYTISSGRNAMLKCGILRVYFDTFSSKNESRVTFINNYNQSCSIDFRCCSFTGKERDEETGYGYFGARYMDHELMSMWLSVDPMADKYPNISPYAYCAWNPVRLVDPDGRDWYDIDKNGYIRKNEKKSKDCKDFDVVHSTMTDKTIKFNKKIIEKASNIEKQEYEFTEGGETISGSAMGTQIDINATTEDAKSLYDFCISNTDHIEFSLFQGNSAGTEWYISTSHAHQEDEFSTALGYVLALAGSFYSHQHNHPYLGVDCTKASDGDKTFIRRTTEILKETHKTVSPSYKLSIIVDGNIKNLKYNEKTGFYE
ncbi:MAG: hypothetical protein J6Y78_01205 [Paludibacteraceae bacterium]|nr:hypothetical protein [Paludibacteraceae bacterium]